MAQLNSGSDQKFPLKRVGEYMLAVLKELHARGDESRLRDLLETVGPKLNLSDWERAPYEKSGYIRWESTVHFYSIGCVKAGYIRKQGGRWYLTTSGIEALKFSPDEFVSLIREKYRAWKKRQTISENEHGDPTETIVRQTAFEQAVEQSRTEIEEYISNIDPYDFQKLVAELLLAMGYHIPYVADPGPDGGIDIIAYSDPLGTVAPRIKVQVKHRASQKVSAKEVREVEGLLRKDGDIGLIVSSGGFTSDADREIRASSKHIETMNLNRLVSLWEQHYDKLREEGKKLLPLARLHFLAPIEE